MKNYTILGRSLFSYENRDIRTGKEIINQYDIDYYWSIKEDGDLYYNGSTYQVKRGDIVMLMYPYKKEESDRELIIVHLPELLHYQEMRDLYIDTKRKANKDNLNPCKGEY